MMSPDHLEKEHDLRPVVLPLPYYNCKLKVPDRLKERFFFWGNVDPSYVFVRLQHTPDVPSVFEIFPL